jgi:hypothetical protein
VRCPAPLPPRALARVCAGAAIACALPLAAAEPGASESSDAPPRTRSGGTEIRRAALDLIRAQAPAYSAPPQASAAPAPAVPLFVAAPPRPAAPAAIPFSSGASTAAETSAEGGVVRLAPYYVADDKLRWPLARLLEQNKHRPPDPMPIEKALHTVIGPNVYFLDRKKHWALVRVGPMVFINFNW